MPECAQCGEQHELLDPTFRRPDAYVALSEHERDEHARADDDLCRIDLPNQDPRLFVRCVLPVAVTGREQGLWWGLWAEFDQAAFQRTLDLWNDADQHQEPAFAATIANDVPGQQLCGLSVQVQLTGASTRPEIVLPHDCEHAFAKQCLAGVDEHQAHQWIRSVQAGSTANALDTPHLRVLVCPHVFDGESIRFVVQDQDGDWQFLCGGEHGGDGDEPRVVGVDHLLQRDPSLRPLGERLPRGQHAYRDGPQSEWRIGEPG